MRSAPAIPSAPLWLGLAGLVPFFVTALGLLAPDPRAASFALAAFSVYAAAILSFLGGVRWGLEMARAPDQPNPMRLVFSTAPSIGGWGLALWAIFIPGQQGTAAAFAGLFAAQYVWDRSSAREGLAPAWYPTLREVLTGGVMLACLVLIAASVTGRI